MALSPLLDQDDLENEDTGVSTARQIITTAGTYLPHVIGLAAAARKSQEFDWKSLATNKDIPGLQTAGIATVSSAMTAYDYVSNGYKVLFGKNWSERLDGGTSLINTVTKTSGKLTESFMKILQRHGLPTGGWSTAIEMALNFGANTALSMAAKKVGSMIDQKGRHPSYANPLPAAETDHSTPDPHIVPSSAAINIQMNSRDIPLRRRDLDKTRQRQKAFGYAI